MNWPYGRTSSNLVSGTKWRLNVVKHIGLLKVGALVSGSAGIILVVDCQLYQKLVSVILAASNFIILGILIEKYPNNREF